MLTAAQSSALTVAAAAAVASEKATKLPAELTVPQWADESEWGAVAPGNNCFAIKTDAGIAEVFPTLQACFERHAELITTGKHYAAWTQYLKDGDKAMLCQRIAHSYRPDLLYGTKLAHILQMTEVRAAIAEARKPLVKIT